MQPEARMTPLFTELPEITTLECVRVLAWLGFSVIKDDHDAVQMKRANDARLVLVPRHVVLTAKQLEIISGAAGTTATQFVALAHPRFQSDVVPRVEVPASRRVGHH